MKRKILIKQLKEMHLNFLAKNEMSRGGLCTVMGFYGKRTRDIFARIFSPNMKESRTLHIEGTSTIYWGYEDTVRIYTIKAGWAYTPRRQSLMLLFIEVLKDEVYLKNHFPELLKD